MTFDGDSCGAVDVSAGVGVGVFVCGDAAVDVSADVVVDVSVGVVMAAREPRTPDATADSSLVVLE